MSDQIELHEEISEEMAGMRLDQAVTRLLPDYSRARIQQWIKDEVLLLNGKPARSKDKVVGGEMLSLSTKEEARVLYEAETIPLNIIYEDESFMIINKPAGLVVHPGAGNYTGTLLNGLLAHCPGLDTLPRAGIVHRLDKDTSGLMVVSKTSAAHQNLVAQLAERSVSRHYEAVVHGVVTAGGTIDAPLGRHQNQRQKRTVSDGNDAREAITHYRVIKRYRSHTHVRLQLETGRTHQIRVHMAHIGFPIVGDPLYGGRLKVPKGASPELLECLQNFKRQALHARKLGFFHPETGEEVSWESDLPEDMRKLLALLETDES